MAILTVVGVVALVFGVLVLINADFVRALSKKADKLLIIVDEKIQNYKVSVGIISIAVGISALFLVYYFKARYGL